MPLRYWHIRYGEKQVKPEYYWCMFENQNIAHLKTWHKE